MLLFEKGKYAYLGGKQWIYKHLKKQ
jgi:hypothetical protein